MHLNVIPTQRSKSKRRPLPQDCDKEWRVKKKRKRKEKFHELYRKAIIVQKQVCNTQSMKYLFATNSADV